MIKDLPMKLSFMSEIARVIPPLASAIQRAPAEPTLERFGELVSAIDQFRGTLARWYDLGIGLAHLEPLMPGFAKTLQEGRVQIEQMLARHPPDCPMMSELTERLEALGNALDASLSLKP